MRWKRTILLIPLFAACAVMAKPPMVNSPAVAAAATAVQKPTKYEFVPPLITGTKNSREHVEGLSVQAWTTTVGWNPGRSAFPDQDGRNCTWQLHLLSIGHEPQQ